VRSPISAVEHLQKEGFEDFSQPRLGQLSFESDHGNGCHGSDHAVTQVTKHDGKQEGESDTREQSRVDFLVCRDTVRIDDGLEPFSKLVGPVKSGWGLMSSLLRQDGRNGCTSGLCRSPQGELDGADIPSRTPTFSRERLLLDVVAEQVHGLVDGLFLGDGILPGHQVFRNLAEFHSSRLTSLEQDGIDVLQSRRNFAQ
jgi:hypothetical protein